MTRESQRHVAAVTAAFMIIDSFHSDEGLQLKELYHRTGINKSRILRLTGSMEACGLLTYDAETREYLLGPKLYHYGRMIAKKYRHLVAAVEPILCDLTERTGAVSYVSVRYGYERLVVCRRHPTSVAEPIVKDGQVRPLYIGAASVMLLAHETAQALDLIFEDLRARPDVALPEAALATLRVRARQAHDDGFAVAFGETKPAHQVASVPLFSRHREFVGSLGLSKWCQEQPAEAVVMKQVDILRAAGERFPAAYEPPRAPSSLVAAGIPRKRGRPGFPPALSRRNDVENALSGR